ncbi:unnamed protein product [Linum tenue]|uniref:Uncharacterized protein n=1 Tax=Linum tenue TaxID=586396 RepID=A0AAV0MUV2_9ROSI|nr:unnamed protein product [Linum tenue]
MDCYEATKTVFSRVQGLDPENASKIMGYLLLQDQGDREMIRLAFGPESCLHNLILQAKTHLRLPISPSSSSSNSTISFSSVSNSNTPSTPSTPSSPSPFLSSRPSALRISGCGAAFDHGSSPSAAASSPSLSYANVVNGGSNGNGNGNSCLGGNNGGGGIGNDMGIDEFQVHRDHFSFLDEGSNADQVFDPRPDWGNLLSPTAGGGLDDGISSHFHRRSYSVPGVCFGSGAVDEGAGGGGGGFGWKPCLYFAKGFCKNGGTCKFLHEGESAAVSDGVAALVGSPEKLNGFEQCQDFLMRSRSAVHQQKLAAAAAASQFMARPAASNLSYNECMNLLLQQSDAQRSAAAAALLMGDELHKFSRCRPERTRILNPSARQIYLTFPADSTFREEDVSNYFSIYGPVLDVRIPYQQKRMFGFVTFLYPETVKLILAKGNPHFVCDSRVLVKPYKEKGKIPEKKQQQMERGDFSPSACSSPRWLDSREQFDVNLGARLLYNTQEMLLRKKLEEQTDLQQAIELHGRRLVSLQLLDLKNHRRQHLLNGLSNGSPVSSPTGLARSFSHPVRVGSIDQEGLSPAEENGGCLHDDDDGAVASVNAVAGSVDRELNPPCSQSNGNGNEEKYFTEQNGLQER